MSSGLMDFASFLFRIIFLYYPEASQTRAKLVGNVQRRNFKVNLIL